MQFVQDFGLAQETSIKYVPYGSTLGFSLASHFPHSLENIFLSRD